MPSNGIFAPNLLKDGSSGKKTTTTSCLYPACFWLPVVVLVCTPPLSHCPVYRELIFIPTCAIASGMILSTKTDYIVSLVSVLISPKEILSFCIAYNFTSSGSFYPRELNSREKSFNAYIRTAEHTEIEIIPSSGFQSHLLSHYLVFVQLT